MGTCKDCRHWTFGSDRVAVRFKREGMGACRMTETSDGQVGIDYEPAKNTLAIARDAEGYHAVLRTAPEFGCNQWQEKDPTNES